MRISDWSSDVCSSDLFGVAAAIGDILAPSGFIGLQIDAAAGPPFLQIGRERRKIFVEIIGTIIRVILLDEVAHFGFDRRRIVLCGFRSSRRGGVVRATRREKQGTGADRKSPRLTYNTT